MRQVRDLPRGVVIIGASKVEQLTDMGVKDHPDSARVYPLQVKDRQAYNRSIRELMTWDFDRVIVGHNEIVDSNGKKLLKRALANKGMYTSD